MSSIKDFADGLQQDVVSDIAESYFGARKNLEDMINAYEQMVAEFRFTVEKLFQRAATLHLLLIDDETARDFPVALDIAPSCIPLSRGASVEVGLGPVPFAFTLRKRYEKCVLRAYDRFQKVSDEYLNGRYFDDPERPGRKRLTIHYLRLRALAEIVNAEVRKVNDQISTTGILRYVKGMDPEQEEREQIMGGMSLAEGSDLDKDMFFTPVDFESLGLPEVQGMPKLKDVLDVIRAFCDRTYSANRQAVEQAVAELRAAASREK